MIRYVYSFGDGKADGNGSMKPLLGGKGAGLHEMTRIGLPVPPGFTITTEVCTYLNANRKKHAPELLTQVATALAKVEKSVGKKAKVKLGPTRSFGRDALRRVLARNEYIVIHKELLQVRSILENISAICRISSSPLRTTSFTFFRPEMESEPDWPQFGLRWI
jgi:hypothetical protein